MFESIYFIGCIITKGKKAKKCHKTGVKDFNHTNAANGKINQTTKSQIQINTLLLENTNMFIFEIWTKMWTFLK